MTRATAQDELADLRRRAYGPGATTDGALLERLQQLEDALRTPAARETAVDDAVSEPAVDAATGPTTEEAPSPPPAPREPIRRTLTRRRVLLGLAAVAIAAALVAAVWLLTRTDGTILRRVAVNDTAAQQPLASALRTYGLDPDSYVQFESFGSLAVWTARVPDRGVRCLLVVDEASTNVTYDGVAGWNCTPEGLTPTVDIVQYAMGSELGARPVGSVARFVFLGDRVQVTVVEARRDAATSTTAPG